MNFEQQKPTPGNPLQELPAEDFSQQESETLFAPDMRAESFSNQKRGGRPRLAGDQRKIAAVTLRFTAMERELIDTKAGLAAFTVPEFIRHAALSLDIPAAVPELNREAYSELANLGNNLNQISRAINSDGNIAVQLPTLIKLLPRLTIAVQSLRLALLGISKQ